MKGDTRSVDYGSYSPYITPYTLYYKKTLPPVQISDPAFQVGAVRIDLAWLIEVFVVVNIVIILNSIITTSIDL